MGLSFVTAPAEEPVTLEQAKAQCRVDAADEDALIASLIPAARESVEHLLGRALMTQTLERTLDAFPAGAIALAMPPVSAVTSIQYIDTDGAEQTLAAELYVLDADADPPSVRPAPGAAWPSTYGVPNAVRVRFVAGHADADAVPQAVRHWILLVVGHWYANREAAGVRQMPVLPFVDGLLDRWRTWA